MASRKGFFESEATLFNFYMFRIKFFISSEDINLFAALLY